MTYSAGIDLGGTSTKLALVAGDGRLLANREVPAQPGAEAAALVRGLCAVLQDMARGAGLPFPPSGGLGVGAAGIVDAAGRLTLSGALGLSGDIRGPAEQVLGCPVAIDSDANAGALADFYLGVARGASDVVYLSWGTGIGAGLVLGGRLFRSAGRSMGEIGHWPVDPDSRRRCYCGCRGCLEVEAGGRALAARGAETLGRAVSVEEVAASAATNAACAALLDRAARQVARALAASIVLLNPQFVIVGGGVGRVLELAAVREAFDEGLACSVPAFARAGLTVAASAFGTHAGVIGAALLPRHDREQESRHDRPAR